MKGTGINTVRIGGEVKHITELDTAILQQNKEKKYEGRNVISFSFCHLQRI